MTKLTSCGDWHRSAGYVLGVTAAIAALLARGQELADAVRQAKHFISRAIASAPGIGHGHGPVDHSAQIRRQS